MPMPNQVSVSRPKSHDGIGNIEKCCRRCDVVDISTIPSPTLRSTNNSLNMVCHDSLSSIYMGSFDIASKVE